jgi:hypothetical protein
MHQVSFGSVQFCSVLFCSGVSLMWQVHDLFHECFVSFLYSRVWLAWSQDVAACGHSCLAGMPHVVGVPHTFIYQSCIGRARCQHVRHTYNFDKEALRNMARCDVLRGMYPSSLVS